MGAAMRPTRRSHCLTAALIFLLLPPTARAASVFPGDLNCDGFVNILDLNLVLSNFGKTQGTGGWAPMADANGDAIVNILDLNEVLSNFGNTNPVGCVVPTVFRLTDLDLRDPHVYVDLGIFGGCTDFTDNGALLLPSLNGLIQDDITMDANGNGLLDLNMMLIFRPLDQAAAGGTLEFVEGQCNAPMPGSACVPDPTFVPIQAAYGNVSGTGTILAPEPGSTSGYTPPVANAVGPGFVTSPLDMTINAAGISIPLEAARFAATYVGNPATSLTNGLLSGFISEADADATLLPATLPLIGGQPLSSLLPGGTGNCAAGDDHDLGPDGVTIGWWLYFNYEAVQVTYNGP